MDTLQDRLEELADRAPTGGAPAAELWKRGKHAQRLRAAAVAATVVLVGAVGTAIGVHLAEGQRPDSAPVAAVDIIGLPIEYPVGRELPDLGEAPGPLAAVWLAPPAGGGEPDIVGLVADTGRFGTLPIDVNYGRDLDRADGDGVAVALAPDGRRIAYGRGGRDLMVHDLVSGEKYSPAFAPRSGSYIWLDSTHVVAHSVQGGGDADGWVWEPGTAPKLFDLMPSADHPYLGFMGPYGGKDFVVGLQVGGGSQRCSSPSPTLLDGYEQQWSVDVPVLCDVLGVVGSEFLLGHWRSDGENEGDGTVVALDIRGVVSDFPDCAHLQPCNVSFDDPELRHVLVTAGAPERVSFATDLIGAALHADGGAS